MESAREARRRRILERGTDRLAFITGQAGSVPDSSPCPSPSPPPPKEAHPNTSAYSLHQWTMSLLRLRLLDHEPPSPYAVCRAPLAYVIDRKPPSLYVAVCSIFL
ncbi:hypothetical protein GW17_00018279 [Ensete ventricosum]|nr:hypothetical protein GW17_00018279 [Ensete ventricosum]